MDQNNNIKFSRPVPPFLRYCSAIIPTAFDDSLSYYEALCALYKWLQSNVIDTINHNADITNEFINKEKELEELFAQLKEYVDNYFENLDVQEEINNKLDVMAEDGTLEEIIGHFIYNPASKENIGYVKIGDGISVTEDGTISREFDTLKFHTVAKSSATYIVQLPNGKNLIVDSGTVAQWTDIKNAIDSLGITKFDYAITTHFHGDHYGNNQNLINTYDFTDCTWWIGMKPDFENHPDLIDSDTEEAYDAQVNILLQAGITPIVPENYSEVTLDENAGIKIKFFNTDETIAESYYDRYVEWYSRKYINFNNFSLVSELTFGNQRILFSGDIERPVEDAYCDKMQKVTILTAPHHGINMDANVSFYTALSPEVTLCMYQSTSSTWIGSDYKQFKQIIKNSKKVITAYATKGDSNGLYTFELDGDSSKDNSLGGGLTNSSPNFELNAFDQVASMVNTTLQDKATITFSEWVLNLPVGATANVAWDSSFNTTYAQLWQDLNSLFYLETNYPQIQVMRSVYYVWVTIWIDNSQQYYFHTSINNLQTQPWSYLRNLVSGKGKIAAMTAKEQAVTLLTSLPTGHYWGSFNGSIDDKLQSDAYYSVSVDVIRESSSKTTAIIDGVLRSSSTSQSKGVFRAFFDSSNATEKLKIYRLGIDAQ